MNNYAVPVTVLLVTVTLAAAFLPRHPWILARTKRKAERRILARDAHPATRGLAPSYKRFWGHEMCPLTAAEKAAFARIAEELDHEWVTRAIKAAREARDQ